MVNKITEKQLTDITKTNRRKSHIYTGYVGDDRPIHMAVQCDGPCVKDSIDERRNMQSMLLNTFA